ncbi:SGNH hydrolase-type esterase domain-containing protein [Pestalotiopsis sp. NC0098]|nr:SGNH hydrolase-type esterase domain-containing protein [Pestalotiopsis sp. NC0098]
MKSFVLSLSAVAMAAATPLGQQHKVFCRNDATPAFILAGDSTTAVQSTGGGGWGNGFLSFLKSPAWGINKGHNGATTVSFVAGGDWANVTGYVDSKTADGYDVYVTIQFGHNDQKAAANISLDEYQANLENLANDVKSHGGTPLLVTPLTRRAFTSEHNATDSLHDQRLYTIAAADATNTTYLDLNKYSLEYVDAIGNTSAQAYDLGGYGADTTHLNDYGSVVFGRLVADLLLQKLPELDSWFTPNETLSYDLANGIAA